MMLNSAAAAQRFISTHSPSRIAQQLRVDQDQCKAGRLPSLLALELPKSSSKLGEDISFQLLDERARYGTPPAIRRLQYDSVINSIKAHIDQLGQGGNEEFSPSRTVPSTSDFAAALKVLEYFQTHPQVANLKPTSQIPDVVTAVRTQLALSPDVRSAYRVPIPLNGPRKTNRKCYMCYFSIVERHELYPALCKPCGTFNLAESNLSLPNNLSLVGKTALVTGGRVALGFHTALRLLRCGARVMVSSRYPRDVDSRYRKEYDFDGWSHRLKVIGADFRTAKDVFRLVGVVKRILGEWGKSEGGEDGLKLDVLVNNAAQTLTDSLVEEKNAVNRERKLLECNASGSLMVENDVGYEARVRGGTLGLALEMKGNTVEEMDDGELNVTLDDPMEVEDVVDPNNGLVPTVYPIKSSWSQTLTDIPYEDVITAHSVNTFVPFILCRELLSSMSSPSNLSGSPAISGNAYKPTSYIINVSSREGLFEFSPNSSAKNGHHVHTNMSKAALNMLTETEAARVWRAHHVAMNTVDPGYMSAAPEYRKLGDCPIGFEDGAARVLWPVAIGEIKGEPVWGRFLKHFGETKVDVGKGR
jgi:NAD(P)-dependent dehydrogenase (short-subunit alcohol dehydrogenase family)